MLRTPPPPGRGARPQCSTLADHPLVHDQESAGQRDHHLDPAEHSDRPSCGTVSRRTSSSTPVIMRIARAIRARGSRGDQDRDARRNEPERGDLCGDAARILPDERHGDGLARRGPERREARRGRGAATIVASQSRHPGLRRSSVARGDVQDPAGDERSAAFDCELVTVSCPAVMTFAASETPSSETAEWGSWREPFAARVASATMPSAIN